MKKEMTWSNGCLRFCIAMSLSSLYRLSVTYRSEHYAIPATHGVRNGRSITGAIHPLILITEQRKDFIMNRFHIQDLYPLRPHVKNGNALKHLKDTPYRQTLRKFDQNALVFLRWLALLIRYCLTLFLFVSIAIALIL